MADRLTISVVVPMRNEAADIARCLRALNAQVRPPDEVIVIDNGSTDESVRIVQRELPTLATLRVVLTREATPGPAAARNHGVRSATGQVIAFTDADCVPRSDWVAEIERAFVEDPELDAIGGVEAGTDGVRRASEKLLSATWLPPARRLEQAVIASREDWLHGRFISTFNCAFRRPALSAVGGLDESFCPAGEDMDLWIRAVDRGARIVAWCPHIVVQHRQVIGTVALVRKMFFYGEAIAHLTKRHFANRLVVRGAVLGSWSSRCRVGTVMVSGRAVTIVVGGTVLAATALISWRLAAALAVAALLGMTLRLRRAIADKGFSVAARELPAVVALYILRTGVRQFGLLYGSLKHRLVCV